MTSEPCGDPFSGIGCPVKGCTHDDPSNPAVAEYIVAWRAGVTDHPRMVGLPKYAIDCYELLPSRAGDLTSVSLHCLICTTDLGQVHYANDVMRLIRRHVEDRSRELRKPPVVADESGESLTDIATNLGYPSE